MGTSSVLEADESETGVASITWPFLTRHDDGTPATESWEWESQRIYTVRMVKPRRRVVSDIHPCVIDGAHSEAVLTRSVACNSDASGVPSISFDANVTCNGGVMIGPVDHSMVVRILNACAMPLQVRYKVRDAQQRLRLEPRTKLATVLQVGMEGSFAIHRTTAGAYEANIEIECERALLPDVAALTASLTVRDGERRRKRRTSYYRVPISVAELGTGAAPISARQ
jgi:hypothetical protein